jgi:hypothetical protein
MTESSPGMLPAEEPANGRQDLLGFEQPAARAIAPSMQSPRARFPEVAALPEHRFRVAAVVIGELASGCDTSRAAGSDGPCDSPVARSRHSHLPFFSCRVHDIICGMQGLIESALSEDRRLLNTTRMTPSWVLCSRSNARSGKAHRHNPG